MTLYDTLLIGLTMKTPTGSDPANLYSSIQTKQCIKDLKYKLKMINKPCLYPVRTSDYSNSVIIMLCNRVLICPSSSNKNSPHSKLKLPSCKIFQLPFPKNKKKEDVNLVVFFLKNGGKKFMFRSEFHIA